MMDDTRLIPEDHEPLTLALAEADAAGGRGEVPVGAVLCGPDGGVLARDGNRILELKDPTAHAEIQVIRAAAQVLGNERLVGTRLYVSLEPCAMCAGAVAMARVGHVVFAAQDAKGGAVVHGPRFFAKATCHHRPLVRHDVPDGPFASRSAQALKGFFRARRGKI